LSGLNFAMGVLYLTQPCSFVLDSPTFSTVSTICVSRLGWEGGFALETEKA
jgi:hypothetical protein